MDSESETTSLKPKAKYTKNILANECIRPFKLQRHFPSTVTELKKNGIEKSQSTIQGKAVTNIISALPLSSNMKFIPNKEVQASEVQNVQKLKLKSINGKDLVEVNVSMANKFQTKMIKIPAIIQKPNKFKKSIEPATEEAQGKVPKIKNITQLSSSSPMKEQSSNSGEVCFSKTRVQIINGEKKICLNGSPSCSKPILIQSTSSDVLKKIESPNIIFSNQPKQSQLVTMKKVPGFPKVLMVQKGSNQIISPTPEKMRQFNLVRKSFLNNQATKDDERVFIQTQISNFSARKRDSSSLDQPNIIESKRSCRDVAPQLLDKTTVINKEAVNKILGESTEIKRFSDQTANTAAKNKNIMVIVPNDAAKELTMASDSLNISNENDLLNNSNDIIFLHDKDIESNNSNQSIENLNTNKIINSPEGKETESNIDENSHNDNNLLDRFSILEKAVLSVKDDDLRAQALRALKDCGIKTKKKVPVKRPVPTKIINESAVQTNVFSLLKEGEFLEADEAQESLIKIKSTCKSSKHSIVNTVNACQNQNFDAQIEFKKGLDGVIDKVFQKNKDVFNVKNAFIQNKKLQAEYMLKKLLKDFELAKNYDSNGYLGIHQAVRSNDLQDIQKHIIILKAAKQNIDICTEDGQTSLELAVELEVDTQIIKILLDSGAEPVSSKAVHNSALILAAKKSSRVLPLLLKYVTHSQKQLINAKNSEGLAAIHYCAQFGNLEGITELIRHGADVNLQDERSGRTALFYAVDTKNSDVPQEVYNEIAQKLVDNGAFSNIPTFSKHSVLTLIDDVKSHSLKIALNRAVR